MNTEKGDCPHSLWLKISSSRSRPLTCKLCGRELYVNSRGISGLTLWAFILGSPVLFMKAMTVHVILGTLVLVLGPFVIVGVALAEWKLQTPRSRTDAQVRQDQWAGALIFALIVLMVAGLIVIAI